MSHFVDNIRDNITRYGLLHDSDKVIVAVSGGADSVALLSALITLGYDCIVAHCDFHLRGDESERDRCYVESLAGKYGVACEVIHFDVPEYEKQHGVSTEMACRELRYEWFEQLRVKYNAKGIAVAHHRDDNIETFFLNLLRGTGIAGLAGMKPRNGNIIRPMLDCTRQEVEEYLREQKLDYVTDSTNRENEYKRNRLRNIVIPEIGRLFPGAEEAMASTISLVRDNEAVYREAIETKKRLYVADNNIDVAGMVKTEKNATTVLFEILHPYGFNATHVADIIASSGESGRRFFSQTHVALLNRGTLIFTNKETVGGYEEHEVDLISTIAYPINLSVDTDDYDNLTTFNVDNDTLLLDAAVLDGNPRFLLRRWRKGDRLAPFGMKGTKKVSDIFSDAKLSLQAKSRVWLLTRNNEILWIVGLRASRHFPLTPTTSRYLKLNFIK